MFGLYFEHNRCNNDNNDDSDNNNSNNNNNPTNEDDDDNNKKSTSQPCNCVEDELSIIKEKALGYLFIAVFDKVQRLS